MKKRLFSAIAAVALLFAALSACASFPFWFYQPKAPKALIKDNS